MAAYFTDNSVSLSLDSYTGDNENVATLVNKFPPLILVSRADDENELIYDQYDSYIYDNLGSITQTFTVQDYNNESYKIYIRFASEEDGNVYVSDFLTIDSFDNGTVILCNDNSDCFTVSLFISVSSSNIIPSFRDDSTINRTVTNIKPLVVNFSRPPRVSPFNFEFRLAAAPIITTTTSPSAVTITPVISVVIPNFVGCPDENCNTLGF
jgi:hypothetical protein